MLRTLKIKLSTDAEQFAVLLETMKRFNEACNYISNIAFEGKVFSQVKLHKECYYEVRERYQLPAQLAVRAIGKVTESYRVEKKHLHTFKETGAIVYDERILSFKALDEASITTLEGRIRVPIVLGRYHQEMVFGRRIRGQADLIIQKGIFYLMLVVDTPDEDLYVPDDFLGVDLGIVNIAVDSEGEATSGSNVNTVRAANKKVRARLQSKGTKSAKRLLKHRSKKEKLFARDVNHCVSKKIVEKAKALGYGIAIENLSGIRSTEKTVSRQQRYRHSSWTFYLLRNYISYKAKLAGVPVVLVDPAYTSQTCPVCGHIAQENRVSRNDFCCQSCGYAAPADSVAAVNIRSRAVCQSAERRSA